MSPEEFSPENYYSLLELLDKLGKEGVAELVTKGKPQRITQGDMIYFLKSDVNRILGDDLLEGQESVGLIVDVDDLQDLASQLSFNETIIRRQKMGEDEEVYHRVLDMPQDIIYGRSCGDPLEQQIFKECGIISSQHGKLYLDEDCNLLYENLGANKSKIRGSKDKIYSILEQSEIGVLIAREMMQSLLEHPHVLSASIKIGFQLRPHFIIRIRVTKK